MTARVNMLYVTLERDMREDDVIVLTAAIALLRGVLKVDTNIADPIYDHIARVRARGEMREMLANMLIDMESE